METRTLNKKSSIAVEKMTKKLKIFVVAGLCFLGQASWGSGVSGNIVPTKVSVEMGRVYVFGAFSNPDQCATSEVVVLVPANPDELNRMLAIAMTAVAANKPLSMWLNGCTSVPWYASAPQATTVGLVR